jgi:putative peptidoglycan lipid II flippase
VNIVLKILLGPELGAAGLALATSAGISLYALMLFRAARAKGYLAGPRPVPTMILVGAGAVSVLAILTGRDLLLAQTSALMPSAGLFLALLFLGLAVLAFHAAATVLALRLSRGAATGPGAGGAGGA